jgi:anti-sigma factor RsiW
VTDTTRRPGCIDDNMLAEYIDGNLELPKRAELEAHLADCEDCYESFVEAVKVTGAMAMPAAASPHAPRTSAGLSPALRWVVAVAATVAIAGSGLYLWQRNRSASFDLGPMVHAVGSERFSEGRVAEAFQWGPRPSFSRGETDDSRLRPAVRSLALEFTGTDRANDAPFEAGVAFMVLGKWDAALERFAAAANQSGMSEPVAVATAAALIERSRINGTSDLSLAVTILDGANPASPSVAWRFNRALALEMLGRREDALQEWQRVVSMENNPNWRAEAEFHIQRLK